MEVEEDNNFYPDTETVKTHDLCATITPFNLWRRRFSYLTGVLPHNSSKGNLYVMALYDYDSNAILDEPIENSHSATIRDDLLKINKFPKERGSNSKVNIMDNKCSSDLK